MTLLGLVIDEEGVAGLKFLEQGGVVDLRRAIDSLTLPIQGLKKIAVGSVTARERVHETRVLGRGGFVGASGELDGHFRAAQVGVGGGGVEEGEAVEGGRVVVAKDESGVELADGIGVFAEVRLGDAEGKMSVGNIGFVGNSGEQPGFGLGEFQFLTEELAASEGKIGTFETEAVGLHDVLQGLGTQSVGLGSERRDIVGAIFGLSGAEGGLGLFLLGHESEGDIKLSEAGIGAALDGIAKNGEGLVGFALGHEGVAPGEINLGVVGVDVDGVGKFGDRVVRPREFEEGGGGVVMGLGGVLGLGSEAELFEGGVKLVEAQHAEAGLHVRGVFAAGLDEAVEAVGRGAAGGENLVPFVGDVGSAGNNEGDKKKDLQRFALRHLVRRGRAALVCGSCGHEKSSSALPGGLDEAGGLLKPAKIARFAATDEFLGDGFELLPTGADGFGFRRRDLIVSR